MGNFDGLFADVAELAVGIFSTTPIVLVRREQGYDVATGTETVVETIASVVASPPAPFQRERVDGSAILATDSRVLVPQKHLDAASNFDPDPGDADHVAVHATIQGKELSVVRARRLSGGDATAAWELQLRA